MQTLKPSATDKSAVEGDVPSKPLRLDTETMDYLIYAGSLAPSGDNSQHWYFNWTGSTLQLYDDPSRSHFKYSVGGLAQYISYGAIYENISLAASRIGLQTEVFLHKEEKNNLVASIYFERSEALPNPLADYLEQRHTNRRPYTGKKVDDIQLAELERSVSDIKGIGTRLVADKSSRSKLSVITQQGDACIWENQTLHAELFNWLRDEDYSDDGMCKNVLGLNFFESLNFPLLKSWKSVSLLNNFGLSRMMGRRSKKLMDGSPLHILLTSCGNRYDSYFEAGRAMQRLWLTCTKLGLSAQLMTGSIMLLHHHLFGSRVEFDPRVKKRQERIGALYKELIDPNSELPVLLFRVGYGRPTKHFSSRRKVEDLKIST